MIHIFRFSSHEFTVQETLLDNAIIHDIPYATVRYHKDPFFAADFSVFTSKHAINAVSKQFKPQGPIFTPGSKTAEYAKKVWPTAKVYSPSRQGSLAMAKLIMSIRPDGHGVWYHGHVAHDDFLSELEQHYKMKHEIVYEIEPMSTNAHFMDYVHGDKIDFVVFQGIQQVQTVEKWVNGGLSCPVVAMSSRIADALTVGKWESVQVFSRTFSDAALIQFCLNWGI